jgi:predicted ATP-grasp superfamily ATP-dependent carboligase
MTRGLLDGITDPETWARVEERKRIAERVAEQMGCTPSEARQALDRFETNLSHEGHVLH